MEVNSIHNVAPEQALIYADPNNEGIFNDLQIKM